MTAGADRLHRLGLGRCPAAVPLRALSRERRESRRHRGAACRAAAPALADPRCRDQAAARLGLAARMFQRGDNEGVGYFEVDQRNRIALECAQGVSQPDPRPAEPRIVTGALVRGLSLMGCACPAWCSTRARNWSCPCARRSRAGGRCDRQPRSARTQRDRAGRAAGGTGDPPRSMICRGWARISRITCNCASLSHLWGADVELPRADMVGKAGIALEYALRRSGPMAMAPSQLGIFARSSEAFETANIEYHVQPLSLDAFGRRCTPIPV